MRNILFPQELKNNLCDSSFELDTVGLSGSHVMLFDNCVLKIQPDSPESKAEYAMMTWLSDKLPVPR